MTDLDDLYDLIARAQAAPWGPGCSALWAQAARLAEDLGRDEDALECYSNLVTAYTMGGEATRVIAPFTWCDNMYRTRPDLFTDALKHSFAWQYKYVITALRQVPTVPVQKCKDVLQQMRELYLSLGDELSAVYIREYLLLHHFGEYEDAEKALSNWRAAARTEFSDCVSCDPMHEVRYYSHLKEWDRARSIGEEILNTQDSGSCEAQPEALLTVMMMPWLYTGNDSKAWAAHVRSYRRDRSSPAYLEYIPEHIKYLTLSGRTERALHILLRHLPWWERAETPTVLMELAIAGAQVTAALPPEGTFHGTLPGETLPWHPTGSLVNPTNAQARAWFTTLALDIAALFDARPGLTNPHTVTDVTEQLDTIHLDADLNPADVDTRTAIPDFSGVFNESTEEDTYPPLNLGDRPWLDDTPAGNVFIPTNTIFDLSQTGTITYPFTGHDDAYRLIAEAMATEDPMIACQMADQAMRTHTNEPIGVRIMGYRILGNGAYHAGYLNEAIDAYRNCLNLTAACGLIPIQLACAVDLCRCLNQAKRHHEAAEVAEMTLMTLDNSDINDANETKLRSHLVTALSELEYNGQAAEHALELAENSDDNTARCEHYETAAHLFASDGNYERAKTTWQTRLTLTHPDAQQQAKALYQYCRCIADQPGRVPEHEIIQMETIMDELHTIVTSEGFDEHHSPKWHHAEWLSDKAYMHWHCDQQTNAIAYMQAATEAFHDIDAVVREAKTHLNLGYMHVQRDEHDTALHHAGVVLVLLSSPRFFGNPLINEAQQLIAYINDTP
ncbi:hypothetical protein ACTRLV_12280 [Corynebacterium durum]|uniref:hypothetical protein n=1 Tax=Corynebacterium durum TaxID=61592 RepID=UPI0040432F7A